MSTESEQALANGNANPEQGVLAQMTKDAIDAMPEPNKKRSTPVKGVCINCKKHFSRHHGEWHYCTPGGTLTFKLERTPEPPAKPGKWTQEQEKAFLELLQFRDTKRVQMELCEEQASVAVQAFEEADAAMLKYLRDNTL